jgi:NADH-quinone oxidoreductase subunit H
MKLGFYLFAEYINMFISSVIMATLFWGGYDIPIISDASLGQSIGANWLAVLQGLSLFIKTAIFIFFFMWIRWTIPRLLRSIDEPGLEDWFLSLINMVITAAVVLYLQMRSLVSRIFLPGRRYFGSCL